MRIGDYVNIICESSCCMEYGSWVRVGEGPPLFRCDGCAKLLGATKDRGRKLLPAFTDTPVDQEPNQRSKRKAAKYA